MSTLRSEIEANYLDMYYLVAPHKASIPKRRESDNGVSFSSEYYIYLKKNNELLSSDLAEYETLIRSCMLEPGLISQVPKDDGQFPPDDTLACMAACSQLDITSIPNDVINYGFKHFGFFNNKRPVSFYDENDKISWGSFLWRQLQLVGASYAAARRGKYNPLVFSLFVFSALTILVAAYNVKNASSDECRLSFQLTQAMCPVSLMSRIASYFWVKAMKAKYGNDFMSQVCMIYYKDNHPFWTYAKY